MKPRMQVPNWRAEKIPGGLPLGFKAGAKIFAQGDPAEAVFYLHEGAVKYQVRSPKGRKAILGLFHPGDFFGLGSITGERAYRGTAFALADCRLVKIPAAEMARLLEEKSAAAKLFTAHLLSRVSRYQEELAGFHLSTSEKRLACLLVSLAQFKGNSRTRPIVPHLHQQDLADMVGTTRSRVNYFMNRFRKLGLIEYNRDIRVHRALRHWVEME